MKFTCNNPILLILIPMLITAVLLSAKKLHLNKYTKTVLLTLRILVLTLLILAISGVGFNKHTNITSTIFSVDISNSIKNETDKMLTFIRDSVEFKTKNDKVGVVCFGNNAVVETTPQFDINIDKFTSKVDKNFTNIENSINISSSIIPSEDKKRIVLITDGKENVGDVLKYAKTLKNQNIKLDIYPIRTDVENEVAINTVKIPKKVYLNQQFDIEVNISSTIKTNGKIRIYGNNGLLDEKEINIQKGENNFVFRDTATLGGAVSYMAELEVEQDTMIQNNTVSEFTLVKDEPHILVLDTKEGYSEELVSMIEDDINITVMNPNSISSSISNLQKYDGYIITNVAAEVLGQDLMKNIEILVKDLGKGLLVIGGENSYALGGYFNTPLEECLPVDMDIKSKEKKPSLALVLVIDKSGSMSSGQYGVSKVELAKEAAIRSTEILTPNDYLGVIAFDGAVKWAVETQKVENKGEIQQKIGSIRSSGGTTILPSLWAAFESLENIDAKLKHIILLTDGQAEKDGYEFMLQKINENKITLSTVAVGEGSDKNLLKFLADSANGRYYLADVFTDIPKIFINETYLAGKKFVNNQTFFPELNNYSPIVKAINEFPSIDGYVSTTIKPTATEILSTYKNEPLLSAWQYGLGRSVAWTSDINGMWSNSLLSWDNSVTLWKNIISWIVPKYTNENYYISAKSEEGMGVVDFSFMDDNLIENLNLGDVHVISPSGKQQTITLDTVSPGEYRGVFNSEETGIYVVNTTLKSESGVETPVNTQVAINYSPEFKIENIDTSIFFERIVHESGGRIITSPEEVFKSELYLSTKIYDLTPLLILLIIIIFMLDITVRRINIPFEKIIKYLKHTFSWIINIARQLEFLFSNPNNKRIKIKRKNNKKSKNNKDENSEDNHISILINKKNI